jgi:hypothetical protein
MKKSKEIRIQQCCSKETAREENNAIRDDNGARMASEERSTIREARLLKEEVQSMKGRYVKI